MDADQISGLAEEGISLIQARRLGWQLLVSTDSLVLCNWYGRPIVEFKMARRQGATREHVLCDLWSRRNAGAGPFSTQPCGPQFFERISASLARPVSQRIQALRSLLEIRQNSSRRLASHTGYTTLNAVMIYVHSIGRAVRYFPDLTALAVNGTRSTFRELHARVGRIAAGLTKHGFKP